jgi:BED zinc finger
LEISSFFEEQEPVTSLASTSTSTSTSISTSNCSISSELNILSLGGRKFADVWKYFIKHKTKSPGHYSAVCHYCQAKWSRGEPLKLESHLALKCPKVDNEIRQEYLIKVALRNNDDDDNTTINSKKRKLAINQSDLNNFFPAKSEEGLSEGRRNFINNCLLKAFVVCGLSFSIIQNPFFINLIQSLCPDYELPSSEILSGRLLDEENAKIILKRDSIINQSQNLTLGIY